MNIVLSLVTSINGNITDGIHTDNTVWSSDEDRRHFSRFKKKFTVIIMGRKTYDVVKPSLVHKKGLLRIVFSRNPKRFTRDSIPNQLEFTNEKPKSLITRLSKLEHTNMLLAGGAEISSLFLSAGCVDEIHLIIEPILFGQGINMLSIQDLQVHTKLLSVTKLNNTGTIYCIYKVIKL